MTRDPRRWVRWPADHPAAGSGADSTWERECCTATVTPAFNGDPEQNTLSIFVLPRNFNFLVGQQHIDCHVGAVFSLCGGT